MERSCCEAVNTPIQYRGAQYNKWLLKTPRVMAETGLEMEIYAEVKSLQ